MNEFNEEEIRTELDTSEETERDDGNDTVAENDLGKKKPFSELLDWVNSVVYAIAAMLVLNTFLFRTLTVSGPSMNNTLLDGDKIIMTNFCYTPEYGDVVVVQADKLKNKATGLYGEPIIKRVIALGGDTIRINFNSGEVFRNDVLLEEDYIEDLTHLRMYGWMESGETYTVPENCVFLMGDNRNVSNDSRNLLDVGFVDEDMIMGKAVLRFYPINEFEVV